MMLLEVDPNLVRPGWTPLVVILLLGVVLFFLGRSMLKQFGRIDVPSADEVAGGAATDSDTPDDADPSGAGSSERAPRSSATPDAQAPRIPDLRARTPDGGRAAPPDQR
jgi:hypothetical protein